VLTPVATQFPKKVIDQLDKAGLPTGGTYPFRPKLVKNRKGEEIIEKQSVQKGPKKGKKGFLDDQGRIWIKDRSHAGLPDHWDVQIQAGEDYFRVDRNGEILP
jgi:hypothetical protein